MKKHPLLKQVQQEGYCLTGAHVVESIEDILKVLESSASSTWSAGQPIGETDAVLLEKCISSNYVSICSKENFNRATIIFNTTLTKTGEAA